MQDSRPRFRLFLEGLPPLPAGLAPSSKCPKYHAGSQHHRTPYLKTLCVLSCLLPWAMSNPREGIFAGCKSVQKVCGSSLNRMNLFNEYKDVSQAGFHLLGRLVLQEIKAALT